MGFISSTHSLSRYHIEGEFDGSTMEAVREGLIQNAIPEIESEYDEISAGWTPFESPYKPDFEKYSFIFGTYFLFSLRIDKKSIPAKLVQKHMAIEIEKKKEETGRDFLSKNEKAEIKEFILDILMHKIPSIPSIYDILWSYEEKSLYLFSTQKAANELFETLFFKSFNHKPVRIFPYTMVEKLGKFTDTEKDRFLSLAPLKY
ncbi:MAG: recombination-associated protein RdgC [Desulfobacter sp.]|nr:MAG: recombination-associated protein RdgC [Desulfobacter sp.]